jgi:hypothetical protein
MIEDELRKVIDRDRRFKHREKLSGLVPPGLDTPFGDFPSKGKKSPKKDLLIVVQPRAVHSQSRACPPPGTGAFKRRPIMPTDFRKYYIRGDLPVQIQHGTSNKLSWRVDIESIEYGHFLPLFIDGIREKEDPYRFIAVQGTYDLLEVATTDRILPVIPQVILPIKRALDTRDKEITGTMCKVIQMLILFQGGSYEIGEALVPYYRQILPVLSLFKSSNCNLLDRFDYSQRKRRCLGDLIEETLQLLERYGGPDAFVNIKYMIPTYEAIVN